ncbi:UDP-N-acetylenolpyruvoylglucosamine reductase [Desulfuribacillus stibiiarsenatis]|uniref:UDP-N-acetylenolpyruvoylglucosamine reductase n=1 Tax=Desulfuribacillus stibiiarsenatis TaxID=1390249 RepID=A0A1E5L5B5_9FIRM|nr:UDP-N-acetylmuramate dehydrogenase [Desulfuribacillus stibiiarsenatis]OEH85352.1 UDP-N-acetylenolpyruvoylglucosamine reductase [Desulfuribacillus stibiiarsenatis]
MAKLTLEDLFERNVPLAEHCSYEIGGIADFFALPENVEELQILLEACQTSGVPYFLFGYGSNLLFPDNPQRGKAFISLKKMIDCQWDSTQKDQLFLSAGVPLSFLAIIGLLCNHSKLNFTHLLPGCIGSGIYINAKCYDDQMSGVIERVHYIDPFEKSPTIVTIDIESCEFAYKQSIFQGKPWIIVGADFKVSNMTESNVHRIRDLLTKYRESDSITKLYDFYQHFKMLFEFVAYEKQASAVNFIKIDEDRNAKKHFSFPSCGSVFKNNYGFGTPMGVIVDQLELKGKAYGGAMISPYHGNFIINYKDAKSEDVKYLIQLVQEKVHAAHGFVPEPEVVIVKS